jgi:hypothetical protein
MIRIHAVAHPTEVIEVERSIHRAARLLVRVAMRWLVPTVTHGLPVAVAHPGA